MPQHVPTLDPKLAANVIDLDENSRSLTNWFLLLMGWLSRLLHQYLGASFGIRSVFAFVSSQQ